MASVAALVALALTASPALAGNGFAFVDWTGDSAGVVSGTLQGAGVTLTGTTQTNVYDESWPGFDADFFAPRLAKSDVVELGVKDGRSFTLAFSRAVNDPLIELSSVASTINIAAQDRVVPRVRFAATHVGEIEGIAATGRRAETEHVHMWRVAGDRLAEHWMVRDDLTALRQLGARVEPVA